MALTIVQLKDLGFKPTKKKSPFAKKYDTLIFTLNKTDYLELGYDSYRKEVNNKIVWKSFVDPYSNKRIRYIVTSLGNTGYTEMRDFLNREKDNANYKPSNEELEYLEGNTDIVNG
jgi:hypothetical protein